jgi:hypothetical protein
MRIDPREIAKLFRGDIRAGDDAGNTLRVRSFFRVNASTLHADAQRNALTIQQIRQRISAPYSARPVTLARDHSLDGFPPVGFPSCRSLLSDFAPESAFA